MEGRGGEGRGGEGFHFVVSFLVYFGLLYLSYRHLEARGKSYLKFLDWILKLVWDLFPYAIVALMFAAVLVMNGSIVVGRFTHSCDGKRVERCACWLSYTVHSPFCTLRSGINDVTAVMELCVLRCYLGTYTVHMVIICNIEVTCFTVILLPIQGVYMGYVHWGLDRDNEMSFTEMK